MNFSVEKIGKIRKADIAIDGITVVAGPNSSGKSTIGRVLMTWCSVLRRLPSRLLEEKLKSARESVDCILKAHDLPEVGYGFTNGDGDKGRILRPETWRDSKAIEERLREIPEYFLKDRNAHEDAERIVAINDEIIGAMDEILRRDSGYYLPTIITDSFETALDKEFASFGSIPGQCSVCFTADENVVSSVQFNGGKACDWVVSPSDRIPLVFYFEPVHLLDWYAAQSSKLLRSSGLRISATGRYKAPDADWRKFLFGEVDRSEWSVERKQKQEEIEKILDELLEMMRGRLEKQDRELRFVDMDVSVPVSVMNVASGIKTMSTIEKGIRAGVIQPGCLLIIDEPESNLHPQWQVEFAHFLVRLNARFGMRLLLNTHSPFFLKAVEVFSREEDIGKRTTHYYHMARTGTEPGYSTKELKDGTNEIFKTYFDAMNDLMSR